MPPCWPACGAARSGGKPSAPSNAAAIDGCAVTCLGWGCGGGGGEAGGSSCLARRPPVITPFCRSCSGFTGVRSGREPVCRWTRSATLTPPDSTDRRRRRGCSAGGGGAGLSDRRCRRPGSYGSRVPPRRSSSGTRTPLSLVRPPPWHFRYQHVVHYVFVANPLCACRAQIVRTDGTQYDCQAKFAHYQWAVDPNRLARSGYYQLRPSMLSNRCKSAFKGDEDYPRGRRCPAAPDRRTCPPTR